MVCVNEYGEAIRTLMHSAVRSALTRDTSATACASVHVFARH